VFYAKEQQEVRLVEEYSVFLSRRKIATMQSLQASRKFDANTPNKASCDTKIYTRI